MLEEDRAKRYAGEGPGMISVYERAPGSKKLSLLNGGRFEADVEAFDEANGTARDWFGAHLVGH